MSSNLQILRTDVNKKYLMNETNQLKQSLAFKVNNTRSYYVCLKAGN